MPPDANTRTSRGLTCRDVVAFLASYLDGALAGGVQARFEVHLERCPDCRAYLDQYECTRALARAVLADDAVDAEVPEALVQAILAARSRAAE